MLARALGATYTVIAGQYAAVTSSRAPTHGREFRDMLLEHGVGGGDLAQNDVINPKTGVGPWLGICLFEQACVDDGVMQDQAPTASEVEIDYLDIGIDPANVLLTRKLSGNDSHEPRESECSPRCSRRHSFVDCDAVS